VTAESRLSLSALVIRAPTVPLEMLEEEIELSGLPVRIVAENRFAAIADSHLALCASGTATLEVGLLGTPMVMLYRLGRWTYLVAKLLVHLPYVSLVNLVLGRWHADTAALRRYLVDEGFLDRADRQYWRTGGTVPDEP